MTWVPVVLPTPCGNITVYVPAPALPPIPFPPDLPIPFFFDFKIPLPDCSLLKHTGSAPEPEEDSHP